MSTRKFIVPIEVTVNAADQATAEAEVMSLMEHALETGNDQGIFRSCRLHETSDTI